MWRKIVTFGMLEEYELDYHTGTNIIEVADEIYNYISGYPYLVSAICKYLDEELSYQDDFTKFFVYGHVMGLHKL